MFSWLSADKKESIRSIHSNHCKTVYLLQPNGEEPIMETEYNGYGIFGGEDAFEWLAKRNINNKIIKKALSENYELRTLGIYLDYSYYKYKNNNYCFVFGRLFPEITEFGNYEAKVDGKTINQHIADGTFKECPLTDFFGEIIYPLKFSFNKNAKYEDLPASETDPNQGF